MLSNLLPNLKNFQKFDIVGNRTNKLHQHGSNVKRFGASSFLFILQYYRTHRPILFLMSFFCGVVEKKDTDIRFGLFGLSFDQIYL